MNIKTLSRRVNSGEISWETLGEEKQKALDRYWREPSDCAAFGNWELSREPLRDRIIDTALKIVLYPLIIFPYLICDILKRSGEASQKIGLDGNWRAYPF